MGARKGIVVLRIAGPFDRADKRLGIRIHRSSEVAGRAERSAESKMFVAEHNIFAVRHLCNYESDQNVMDVVCSVFADSPRYSISFTFLLDFC